MINISLAIAPENNIVVHAAAGTGKTWLLTSRVIRLLLEGHAPGSILAITFTRKAAGEIHERIMEKLLALAGDDDQKLNEQLAGLGVKIDPTLREVARGLYEKYLNAIHPLRATTFHAFCQDVLRRFPLEADVPPGFELVESTAEIEDAAWAALDRKLISGGESALTRAMDTLFQELGVTGARQALNDFLMHRSDWWAYTENKSDPARFSAAQLRQFLQITDDTSPIEVFIRDVEIRNRIARFSKLLAGHPTATNLESVDALARALADKHPAQHAFDLVRGSFLKNNGEPYQMKRSKTLTNKIGDDAADELIRLHGEIITGLLATLAVANRQWTCRVSDAWYLCGQALLDEYQRLKTERHLLDFADLEWKTYRLLDRSRHAEWVQYKLDQRIDHLLIDEFQDTNPTQWRLMLPLLEEMAAGDPERKRSVFLVGDEKQSIYRFRRADSRLLHTARHWLEEHAQARTLAQHISWRSSPAIIHFVNLVFHRTGEASTEAADDFLLQNFSLHDTHFQQLWGHAELLPLIRRRASSKPETNPAWRNPLEQPRETDEDARHREEGDLIAARILALLGTPIMAKTKTRPLHAGDVIILLRDRNYAGFYEEALRRAGIPYAGTGRGTLLQSLEVRDLLHLIRILVEPYNDIALASALRSPVFAATEADLLRLAQVPPGPWRGRLTRLTSNTGPSEHDPLARAEQLLSRWKGYADRIPVHDLLDRIYNEGNIVARYVAAAPKHLRSRVEANLNRLLELALDMDSGRYPSLSHFLAYLENHSVDDTAPSPDVSWNREPRVRVMTIHAAKGLESPVVFLADAARVTGDRERGARIVIEWPITDRRPRHFHLAGAKTRLDDVSEGLLHEQRWAGRREEANLLYVALTRAKQILYVSGCEPGTDGPSWYRFIEKRLLRAAETGAAVESGLELITVPANDGETAAIAGAWIKHGGAETREAERPIDSGGEFTLDPALTRPIPRLTETAVLSPSRLTGAEDDSPDDTAATPERRQKLQRRGTVIHRMLEKLTLGIPRRDLEENLRWEFSGETEPQQFDVWWREACGVIDSPALREFFDPGRYREARNEIPILYREGDRDVYGVIDRLLITDEDVILIDYKTHERATPENIGQWARDFSGQMLAYGAGARRLWPDKKLRLVLLFTACRGVVEIPVT